MSDDQEAKAARLGILGKYSYAWLTLAFFLISLLLHWYFGWRSFVDEAQTHREVPQFAEYLNEMGRDTFENWQSEFLQLIWQVVGLAYFLYLGSPSSKEGGDRLEAKIDALIRLKAGEEGDRIIHDLDAKFLRHGGHAKPFGHEDGESR